MNSPLIDATTLQHQLGRADLRVLDASVELPRPRFDGDHRAASGRDGWVHARIPGARHLDLLEEFTDPEAGFHFARPPLDRAARVLDELGVHEDDEVVLYDRHDGFWAARTWWTLRSLGVGSRVLDGGLAAWTASGGAVEHGEPPAALAPTGARPVRLVHDPSAWVDREAVLDIVEGRRAGTLVCALGAEQFTAVAHTRYSRRGHIPGSFNLPARDLTGTDGTFLAVDALRRRIGALPAQAPLVLYCGGAISASFLALGLVVAGHGDLALYDGSLEEWSADPSLPLVV